MLQNQQCYSHPRRKRLSKLKQINLSFRFPASSRSLFLFLLLAAGYSMGTDSANVSFYLDEIDRIEASSNAFDPQLGETYMSLGKSLIDDGNFPEAQDALKRGVQIERINFGLHSLSQTPHLMLLADLEYVLGNNKEAQKASKI